MKKNGLLLIIFSFLFCSTVMAQESVENLDSLNTVVPTQDSLFAKVSADSMTVDSSNRRSSYQMLLLGIKNLNEKDYLEAISFFNNVIEDISDKRIYLYRGRAFLGAGNYENAVKDFMEYNKHISEGASLELAKTYAALNSPGIAIQHLKNHLKSPYRLRWSEIMKDSLIMKMQGDPVWTNFTDKQIVPEAEKSAIAAEEKAEGEFYREALNLTNQAIGYEPKNPDWYKLRAAIYVETGNYDKAIKDYKRELSLAPHRMNEVYKNMAFMFVRNRDLKTASVLLNEIVKKDPFEFFLLLDVAEIEKERYNRKGALEAINRYLEVMPEDDEVYFLRAQLVDNEQAKKDIETAINLCKINKKQVPKEYLMLSASLKK